MPSLSDVVTVTVLAGIGLGAWYFYHKGFPGVVDTTKNFFDSLSKHTDQALWKGMGCSETNLTQFEKQQGWLTSFVSRVGGMVLNASLPSASEKYLVNEGQGCWAQMGARICTQNPSSPECQKLADAVADLKAQRLATMYKTAVTTRAVVEGKSADTVISHNPLVKQQGKISTHTLYS